jgi:hypothetical protein
VKRSRAVRCKHGPELDPTRARRCASNRLRRVRLGASLPRQHIYRTPDPCRRRYAVARRALVRNRFQWAKINGQTIT